MPQDPVISHLNRIKGQLTAIENMYNEGRSCVEIVRLTVAVRNSLGKLAQKMLSNEASVCSREARHDDLQDIINEVFKY